MEWINTHDWPATRHEARALEDERYYLVRLTDNMPEPRLIGAVDTAYGFAGKTIYTAAVVLSFPDLAEVERRYHHAPVTFPYFAGLFYFREGPALVEVLGKLQAEPDVIVVGGHGIAHPRGCGIASHIGIDFDIPTVGCARRLLCGYHEPVDAVRNSFQAITFQGSDVGIAYRTKDNVKPVFISPGYRCDVAYARDLIVRCLNGFRLPEPLRVAHLLANRRKRSSEKGKGAENNPEGD